jgi:hypothetical protein
MFVVVTIVVLILGWLTHNLNWIRQRHEFWDNNGPIWCAPNMNSSAPGLLWIFGENGTTGSIVCYGGKTVDEARKTKANIDRLFPESSRVKVYYDEQGNTLLK